MTCTLSSMERLVEALNAVKRQCPDVAVESMLWMHVKHPIHPAQEALLKQVDAMATNGEKPDGQPVNGGWRDLAVLLGRACLCVGYAIHLTARLARLRWRLRHSIRSLRRQSFDLVAKSWCFEAGLLTNGRDFYYGDLQQRLADRGLRMLILTGHPTESWRAMPAAKASAVSPHQLPEFCLIPYAAPLWMAWHQWWTALRLWRMARHTDDPIIRWVVLRASQDSLSSAITPIGVYDWIGRSIGRIWHPKAFVTLYEGYAWEQCLWRGLRAVDPACRTVGYQHSVLLRHNLALLQPQQNGEGRIRPEVVMCLGPRTQSMLRASHQRSELFPFGTFRRPPQAQTLRAPCPGKRTVLVLPEGFLEEMTLLFNTAMQVARSTPHYRFILRCHPVLPFHKVQPLLECDPLMLPNVIVSTQPVIERDFEQASVILYRGSSAVLYAVLHGLKPIYLDAARHHEVDPLFELRDWPERASSVHELNEILQRYGEADPDHAAAVWRPAAEYVDSYTVAVDGSSIDRLLSTIGVTASVMAAG
ncbi:MAG: hypothetical protein HYZ91_02820 [Candidatus Omnitrophica bacterium]|nr:hypothetical protein [Candidatus Omnitrophota bacterium]